MENQFKPGCLKLFNSEYFQKRHAEKPGCLKLFNSEYFQKRHAERMLDDIPYILGFRGIANDFIYPEAEDIERARMCALEQPLNKDRLEELNKIIDGSDWARWNDGEFSRELFEEFGNKA